MARGKHARQVDAAARLTELVPESALRLDKLISLDYDQQTASRLIANWLLVETEMLNEGDK